MSSSKTESAPVQDLNDSGCVQDSSVCEGGSKRQVQLLELSDDELLYILQYCSPRDLKALGFTCTRLATLVCDHTLWQRVDCRDGKTGQQRMRWLLTHCLSHHTTELKIKGYVNSKIRCLGISEQSSPLAYYVSGNMSPVPEMASINTENNAIFLSLLRSRHLPSYSVGPRWPDRVDLTNGEAQKSSDLSQSYNTDVPHASRYEPGTSIHGESSALHRGPTGSKFNGNTLETTEAGSSNSDINSLKQAESNGLKASEVNCINSKPSGMNIEPNIRNGEPFTSQQADAEPLDVTMPVSSKNKPAQAQRLKPSHNCPGPRFTFNTKLMRELKYICTNLSALFIEYCFIDYKTTNISQFPPQLKKLSLKGSRCFNQPLHTSYLCKIQDYLPNLEYLDVSSCDWFEPASLMPISKVPNLRELYMCDCMRLRECVAYASLAARYGFRELRVLDARGSPLADSEVSALGWLPQLRELYAAPPPARALPLDHAHSWTDPLLPCQELDPWELEEPEYFKSKTCEVPDSPPQEESPTSSIAEIRELRDTDMGGDRTWSSYGRRIIVIQPNANREMVVQPQPRVRLVPYRRPGQDPAPGPSKRPHNDQALDLVKRPRLNEGTDKKGANNLKEGLNETNNLNKGADQLNEGSDHLNKGADQLNEAADHLNEATNHTNEKSDHNKGSDQLNEGADQLDEEADHLDEEADVEDDADQLNPRPDHLNGCVYDGNENAINHYGMACAGHNPRSAPFCDSPSSAAPSYHNLCYDLVTDSAVFRFGRGDNEHVVHLGVPPANEPGARPDRSSLRVLSLTGYRNITDRSLVHLATAAPHLRIVDFSETSVRANGVNMFKAIRPDCEVSYSQFGEDLSS